MVRIPSEYQEVEYIESTGMQYIDTGYIPVLSPILRMKIRITNRDDKDIAGFVSNVYPSFIIDAAPFQSRWYNRYGNTAAYSYGVTPSPVIGQIQEWEWGKEVKFNGNLVHTNTECDWSSNTQKMNIFSGRNKAFVAIYTCSLYDGDLVRNLIPCYHKTSGEIGMYDTVTGAFFTNQGTGTFLKGNDVTYDTVNLMESRRRILLNTPHLESLSGSTLSFKTDMASKLKECKIHFTPIQEGSGDPSPDNVRPIHGWDGVTVTRCGKNLLDTSQLRTGYYIDANGNENAHAQFGYTISYTPVKENTVYTLSGNIGNHASAYGAVYCYNKNKEFIDRLGGFKTNELPHTFTTPEGTAYVNVQYAIFNSAPQNVQIELGSTATTYEPYKPITTLTIPFPQTIYGGYVDLVKGEVVEEWNNVKGDDLNWSKSIGNYSTFVTTPSTKPKKQDNNNEVLIWSSHYKSESWRSASTVGNKYVWVYSNGLIRLKDTKKQDLTAEEFVVTVADADFCYKIPPTTYPLDPVTIRTLKGLNNIFSSANGNIELKFWTH